MVNLEANRTRATAPTGGFEMASTPPERFSVSFAGGRLFMEIMFCTPLILIALIGPGWTKCSIPGGKVMVKLEPEYSCLVPKVPGTETGGLAAGGPGETQHAPSGTATIVVTPVGAEVSIDGGWVGNAPADLVLPAGEHEMEIKMTGYTSPAGGRSECWRLRSSSSASSLSRRPIRRRRRTNSPRDRTRSPVICSGGSTIGPGAGPEVTVIQLSTAAVASGHVNRGRYPIHRVRLGLSDPPWALEHSHDPRPA